MVWSAGRSGGGQYHRWAAYAAVRREDCPLSARHFRQLLPCNCTHPPTILSLKQYISISAGESDAAVNDQLEILCAA
ncbi:hypothetical protein CEP53_010499 [Fusarium sp. AF-6]|nr:hypothetical protein CEP53_010499 [Fusarium sp. AF-6]